MQVREHAYGLELRCVLILASACWLTLRKPRCRESLGRGRTTTSIASSMLLALGSCPAVSWSNSCGMLA
eukprot:2029636-Pleurochrysis_carterae.AAC.1